MPGTAVLGATGGLGAAAAMRLGRRTPVTVGYASNEAGAGQLVDEIVGAGGQARAARVDLTDGDSVSQFLGDAERSWDGLDAIVQATGPAIPLCALEDVTDDDFRRIYDTDVYGTFNLLRHACALMKRGGGGSIVLFLTTAVQRTLENDGMSGCPKHALEGLLRQAARESGPHNVRINGVAPGVIDAGIVHTSFEVDEVAKSVIESCLAQTPLGRMGTQEEVAALVDFLTSPDAAYVSGQVISVDGGYSA